MGEGIINDKGLELETYADGSGMTVKVRTGQALIRGHYYENDSEVTLSIAASDPSLPRIDRVVLRLDPTANSVILVVLTGTPNPSPSAPALTQTNSAVYELPLAEIAVSAAAVVISSGNVTDERSIFTPYSAEVFNALEAAVALKANIDSPSFTGTVTLPSTTSIGDVSNTEIGYLDGVTSAIQTQLDGKLDDSTGAVTTDLLADGAVTEIKLADDAVTTAKIADNAVTSDQLASDSVTEAKIASSAVTETKIANSAVTDAKIAGVDASKVSGTTLVVDRLRGVGTGGMSLSSSTHGLQVGPTDGGNLAFDGNDIQARSNGAANDISINRLGGDVDVGTTTRGFGIEGTRVWANGVYGNLLSTSFRSMYVSNTDTRNKLGYVSSSRETKKNIEPLAYTVEQILSIEPFQYNYKAEEDGQPKHAGFIAEDLHDAGLTGFVSYDEDKPATITYEFYVVALQKVIKDQEARLKDLEQRISNLEN
jgi:hypothetical protein